MVYKLSVLEIYSLIMHNCASAIATIQALLPTLYWGIREPMGLELENATVYEFMQNAPVFMSYVPISVGGAKTHQWPAVANAH